jgi:hypothetical protein
MMTAILSFLGSSTVGSLVGGLLGIWNKKNDLELKKLDHEQERARWSHELDSKKADLEIVRAEAQGSKEVAIIEGEAAIGAARMAAIAKVNQADRITAEEITAAGKWGFLLVLNRALTTFVRPSLTYLVGMTAVIVNCIVIHYFLTISYAEIPADKQLEVGLQAFAWITGQASAMFTYWFVARGCSVK